LASSLHRYPFGDRFLLFIVPTILILIAQGTEELISKTIKASPVILVAFIILGFVHPTLAGIYRIFKPYAIEEIRPVIKYIRQHKQEHDILYVYCAAEPAFKYYSIRQRFNVEYITGSGETFSSFKNDIETLRSKTDSTSNRVWILFSHLVLEGERHVFLLSLLEYLDSIGKRIDSFKVPTEKWWSTAVYLYDLSQH
jgi:hypothetical protein